MVRVLAGEHLIEVVRIHRVLRDDLRPVPPSLPVEPRPRGGKLPAVRQPGLDAQVPPGLRLALVHGDPMSAGRRHPGAFETRRSAADDQHLSRRRNPDEGRHPPFPFAPDRRVVDALHPLAGGRVPPAEVRGHATADVVLPAFARLVRPLRIGEELAGETDGVAVAVLEELLRDVRGGDPADQEHRLRRHSADLARVVLLPAPLEVHRGMDEGVMDAGGDAHVVEVDQPLEVADDLLHLVDLEVPRPEGGGVDPVPHERLPANRAADGVHRLDRKREPRFMGAAPPVGALVVERRQELPGEVAVAQVKLDAVEARCHRAAGGRGVGVDELEDLLLGHRLRRRPARELSERHLARGERVPARVERRARVLLGERQPAHPGVPELNGELRPLRVDRLGNPRERLDVVVGVELRGEEGSGEGVRVHVRRADDDEPDPAPRPLPVVLGRHVGEHAGAVHPGRAGRRKHDAVRDPGPADPPGREEPRVVARHPLPPERAVRCRRHKMRRRIPDEHPLIASRRVCSGARGRVKDPISHQRDAGSRFRERFSNRNRGVRLRPLRRRAGPEPMPGPPIRDRRRPAESTADRREGSPYHAQAGANRRAGSQPRARLRAIG